jgi:hypothetical protein
MQWKLPWNTIFPGGNSSAFQGFSGPGPIATAESLRDGKIVGLRTKKTILGEGLE